MTDARSQGHRQAGEDACETLRDGSVGWRGIVNVIMGGLRQSWFLPPRHDRRSDPRPPGAESLEKRTPGAAFGRVATARFKLRRKPRYASSC